MTLCHDWLIYYIDVYGVLEKVSASTILTPFTQLPVDVCVL